MRYRALSVWIVATLMAAVALTRSTQAVALADGGPRTLPGHVPWVVAQGHAQLLGHHAASEVVRFAVSLPLRNVSALDQFLQSVHDPSSPNYHRYLTLDQANQSFNPTVDQEQQVVQWLRSNSMTVTATYPNHLLVDAEGTAGQVERLLHTTVNDYKAVVRGREQTFYAPATDPVVDASISGLVESITGLDSFPRFHRGTNGGAHNAVPYYPQDFANAYDVNPLWNAGYTGSGQHVGITLWTVPPSDSTLQAFGTQTGASVATQSNGRLKVIAVDGGTTSNVSPDDGEAGMDIESASGMAPGATVDYYEAPTDPYGSPTDKGLEDALNLAGSDANNNQQITNSWGGCEASSLNDPFTSAVEKIFTTNAATGHDYLFSSGDSGSWCDPLGNGVGQDPYPDYPASSPNVTTVGGTRFNAPVTGTYPGESAWTYHGACTSGCPEGSGGGFSAIFSRPAWQSGPGLPSTNARGYPDIAADAEPETGAFVCWGGNNSCGTIGGTSLSSPLWAGMLADLNQYVQAHGKPALGFVNPTLYRLATTVQPNVPFHDITSGTNGKYVAGAGWDAVTGWGTPDLWNIAQDLAPAGGSPPSTAAVEGSDQSLYVNHGTGYTFLGGVMAAAPAVVALPNGTDLYIATGADHHLWERTDTLSWQPLAGGYCVDNPAATVSGTTLIVACTSSDYGIYYATAAIPTTALPFIGTWSSYGGASFFGPAVAMVNGTPTIFAVGVDNRLYWRTASQTWTPFPNTWCTGHPAAAAAGSTSYVGCHGGDNALWYMSNTGSGWSGLQSVGGGLIDGPAIAGTPSGPVFFAEGSDTAVYQRTLATGWQYMGGGVLHGVAATAP